jgi:hypothetical protein
MAPWDGSDTLMSLAEQRGDVALRIQKVLVRRDMIGDWTDELRAEYRSLCEQEQRLIMRMDEMTGGFSSGVGVTRVRHLTI